MITMTASRIVAALILSARRAARFLNRISVGRDIPQAHLVPQRVADRRRIRRGAFGAGGH
jgi:hypothetical protein